jgi:hypothetical protein
MNELCESLGFIPVPRHAKIGTFLRLLYDVLRYMASEERPRDSNEPFGLAELMDVLKQGVLKKQQTLREVCNFEYDQSLQPPKNIGDEIKSWCNDDNVGRCKFGMPTD